MKLKKIRTVPRLFPAKVRRQLNNLVAERLLKSLGPTRRKKLLFGGFVILIHEFCPQTVVRTNIQQDIARPRFYTFFFHAKTLSKSLDIRNILGLSTSSDCLGSGTPALPGDTLG